MRYMTTRTPEDSYTAKQALSENIAPDDGIYIPIKLPYIADNELAAFGEEGFCGAVANILNRLLDTDLNAWDVGFSVGRTPIKFSGVGRKVVVAEAWHNPGLTYSYAVSGINSRVMNDRNAAVSSWAAVSIGIAYLFGIYAELLRNGNTTQTDSFDICVSDGNFILPTSALYAKQMGLPIGKIIISSGSSSAVWDLINRGQMGTSLLHPSQKTALERLICTVLGHYEVHAYAAACDRHGVYSVPEECLDVLPQILFGAVVGHDRVRSIVSNVNRSFCYNLSDDTAVCYGGVQDYRAKTGQGGLVVIFGTCKPD